MIYYLLIKREIVRTSYINYYVNCNKINKSLITNYNLFFPDLCPI